MNDAAVPASSPRQTSVDMMFDDRTGMGRRMRAFDWSASPLGPVETWSQSLRTTVQILLHSQYPMCLWWGRPMTNLYNDAFAPILGQRHPHALGQSGSVVWSDVWHVVGPMAESVIFEGKSVWNEATQMITDRNGYPEEVYFTFSYSPVYDDRGEPGGMLCVVSEETKRVLSERRLKTLQALGERSLLDAKVAGRACDVAAEALAENPLDVPFALIYLLDESGAQARLEAATPAEIELNSASETISIGGENDVWKFRDVIASNRIEVVESAESPSGGLPAELWTDYGGSRALVLPLARPGPREHLAGFLVAGLSPHLAYDEAYRDFLQLAAKQIATALADARAHEEERKRAEALAELDRAKTAFFSNVSHEFRTPLTLLLGPLDDLLEHSEALSEADREQVTLAQRNAVRLLKLVNTLLDFSRIEAGRIVATFEPVDLATFTAELASVFRSAIERAGLRLIVDCPSLDAATFVDREMWEKIVLNLLSNAFKFTFAGEIEVSLRSEGYRVALRVRDTGTGIPADEIPQLFARFHRIEGARGRSVEGSGIGLALVQELVKLHGGTVEVESEVDRGTTFTVRIPTGAAHLPAERVRTERTAAPNNVRGELYAEEALRWLPGDLKPSWWEDADVPVQIAPGPVVPLRGSAAIPRILLADDNADLRDYIRRLLGQAYHVVAVADGESALRALKETSFDLVLADVMMPGIGGFGLLRALREDVETREVPIILLSARAGEEARVEGMAAGADDYLTKPFSANELLARVEAHLRLQRVRNIAEDELRRRTAQFEALLNEAPIGVYLVDADFRFRQVNPTARRTFGDVPGLIGRDFSEVMHILWEQEHADELVRLFRQTLETGASYITAEQIENRRDSGVTEYYEWQISRIPLPDRRYGVVCYFRDVSARVLGRKATAESEERYRLLTGIMSSVVWQADETGAFVLDQPEWSAYTGQLGEQYRNWGWLNALHPDDRDSVRETWQQAVNAGKNYEGRGRIWHAPSRKYRYFLARATPLRTSTGAIRYWIGTLTDVHEGRLGAERIRRLQDVTARFSEAQTLAEVRRVVLDDVLNALDTNAGAVRRLTDQGLVPDEIVRGDYSDLELERRRATVPLDSPHPAADVVRSGEALFIADAAEFAERYPLLSQVVAELDFQAAAYLPLARGSEVFGVLSLAFSEPHVWDEGERDFALALVSRAAIAYERARLFEAEQIARGKAEAAVRARDQFLSIAAHELRTPLSGIRGSAQLLQRHQQRGTLTDERLATGVRLINESSMRLGTLVDDLLDVSRLELGGYPMELEPVDIVDLIEQSVERFRPLLEGRHRIAVSATGELPAVQANASAIDQVVTNLVDNAAKYSPDDEEIDVRLEPDGEGVRISVVDRGIGLPPGTATAIFEPFGRAPNAEASAIQGMGLGLHICRRIVERHGGRIRAESAGEGLGTTVSFWLPTAGSPA